MSGPLKILVATALFGIAHSLLASRSAKRAAERVLETEGVMRASSTSRASPPG